MKRSLQLLAATAIAAVSLAAVRALADPSEPGRVDFGEFAPPSSGGAFVEVNISRSLIKLASRMVPKDEPEITKLLEGLHQIRINVVGVDNANRAELERRMQDVRKQLNTQGWERVVNAQKQGQEVGVYLKMIGNDTVAGLAVVAMENQEKAVFVNIVGNIKPEQVAAVGERLNIDELKRLGPPAEKSSTAKK